MEDNWKKIPKKNSKQIKFYAMKEKENRIQNFSDINAKTKNNTIKNKNNKNNKKENDNQKIKKIRNPGVDLVRIIAMYNIVLTHYILSGRGDKLFPKYKRYTLMLQSFIDWHNDSFILISGIVGYKTNKYSNLIYLWLTVFFYSVGIHKYVIHFNKDFIIKQTSYKIYYPIIFVRYWFFTSYFGMYLFLPIFNKGIEYLSKYEFRLVVMSTLGVFVFWREYKNPKEDIFLLQNGNSILWFLIFYLTGAYIGKYRVDYVGRKKYIFCFLYLFIFSFSSFVLFKALNHELSFKIKNFKILFQIK